MDIEAQKKEENKVNDPAIGNTRDLAAVLWLLGMLLILGGLTVGLKSSDPTFLGLGLLMYIVGIHLSAKALTKAEEGGKLIGRSEKK